MYQNQILIFVYIISFIFSISIFYGNEKKENDETTLSAYHEVKDNLKYVLKYKSNIQEYDIQEGKSYLRGKASIEYSNTKIEADYIEYNWKNGNLYAKSKKNPVFLKTENQQYFASKIHLNLMNQIGEAKNFYKTEKNYILTANNVIQNKEDILMKKVTYISDPFFLKKQDNFPDFYLKTDYLKYSSFKQYIFSGPILFYWYKVPMPFFFPFLYIPIKSQQKSYGLIYPKFVMQNKKVYMENLGLFFTISNFSNFKINTSIYNTEKWNIKTKIEYEKHDYYGLIHFDYHKNVLNQEKNYLFQWKHNFKSNSGVSFDANINYDNTFLYNKNANFSYINIRKKLSNYLWFTDIYMIPNYDKKAIKFIIPELILHTNNILIDNNNNNNKKNYFLKQVSVENKLQFSNFIKFHEKTNLYAEFHNNMIINAYFSCFDPFLKISSKILYYDFYTWNFSHISCFQNMDFSTYLVSLPFYKIWKFNKKNTVLLKHQIQPILSFHILYFPPVYYNVKNILKKRINFILNNDWIIENINHKKIEIFKEIKTSFIIDHNFIKLEKFHIIGDTGLSIKNLETKYKAGINFVEEEKKNNMMYFDFSFSYNYDINLFPIKKEYQKKGKNRYDYFFFDHKNYAKYSIPINLKIDFHSNYEKNYLNDQELFYTFLNLNGSINITKYWKISFNTDYDLSKNKIIFANIIFDRDLRSFEMSFNWTLIKTPSWSFFIGLKDPYFKNIIQYNEKN